MCADAMALNEEEARIFISKIADMLQQQEWAKIIPEIPQLDRAKIIREINERMAEERAKFQKNRSPYGEERGEHDEERGEAGAKTNQEHRERYQIH